jgi:hypothetical protein
MTLSVVETLDDEMNYQIVESDDDGIRMFTTATDAIPVHYWNSAFGYAPAFVVSLESRRVIWVDEVFYENRKEVDGYYIPADWLWRPFHGELVSASELMRTTQPVAAPRHFVHLHTHTEYSALDGLSRVAEIVEQVVADGGDAIAFTDHGNCAVHPEAAAECGKRGIKPIFGMEA